MFSNFEAFQNFGKEQMEASTAAASGVTKSLQAIAAGATDYSKKSIEQNSAFVEKMMGVRKVEDVVALQQDFAKSTFEGFMAQMTKMGELYTGLAKEAMKPVETAMAKAKTAAS